MTTPRTPSRRLALSPLEARDNPAGSVAATFSGGVLTLTGDAFANAVQISAVPDGSGADVVLTGLDDTAIDGPTEFEGVRSIRANLKGGADAVSADPGAAFVLRGSLMLDLGDGDNTVDLQPADQLALGGLTVRAADGADTVKLVGPEGGMNRTIGALDLSYGPGNSTTDLAGVHIVGRLAVAAGEGDDALTTEDVRVGRPGPGPGNQIGSVQVNGGKGALTVTAESSAFPATTVSARGAVALSATDGSFAALAATSPADAQVELTSTPVRRDLTVTAGPDGAAGVALSGEGTSTGRLTVSGGTAEATIADSPLAFVGGLTVTGRTEAEFAADGSAVQVGGPAAVRATAGTASLSAGGERVTFLKSLIVSGNGTDVSFDTTATGTDMSAVHGDFIVTGGKQSDTVKATENFRVGGDVRLALGGGDNVVALGGEAAALLIGGRLDVLGGEGADEMTLTRLIANGPVSIVTGGGADTVGIQGASVYRRSVFIDQGAGDDALAIGTESGGVVFTGPVTIRQGPGADTLAVEASD
ncbi:MAG TPA: hypothetical protein VM597_20290, partial [Gemmataceae bacterium]|nr:hypothetical protein [Gemmataceae bacterium]